jgi:cellobiose phosphorylase
MARSIIRPHWSGEPALQSRRRRLDPCGALQARVELAPDEETEIVFFLGEAATNMRKRSD